MLKFDPAWRFESPGELPVAALRAMDDYVAKIVAQGETQPMLEHFKAYFAGAAGATSSWSSSASWAQTDLDSYMREAAVNAPLFIEAFYDACEALKQGNPDMGFPSTDMINRTLAKHDVPYQLRPPELLNVGSGHQPIPAPERPLSFKEDAWLTIERSLKEAENLFSQGRYRPAVQEILWLLESVSTAFRGLDAGGKVVQGKYFNTIVDDLRRHSSGTALEQILKWVTALHGYLSSPTGGGVRHGVDLAEGIEVGATEARLYCNLIRSYIAFLLQEHARMSESPRQRS